MSNIKKPGFCFKLRPSSFYVVMKRTVDGDKQYSIPFKGSEGKRMLANSKVLDSSYYIKRIRCLSGSHEPYIPTTTLLELTIESSNLLLSLARLALGTASMSKDYNILAQMEYTKIPDCLPQLIEVLQEKCISLEKGDIKTINNLKQIK